MPPKVQKFCGFRGFSESLLAQNKQPPTMYDGQIIEVCEPLLTLSNIQHASQLLFPIQVHHGTTIGLTPKSTVRKPPPDAEFESRDICYVIIPNENGHLLRQWFRQHGIGISLALDVWFRAAAVVTPLDDRKVVIYTVANNFTEDAVGRMLDFLEKERIQEQNGLKLREEPEMEWDFWGDSDNSEDDNDGSLRVGESITSIDGRNFCIRARLA